MGVAHSLDILVMETVNMNIYNNKDMKTTKYLDTHATGIWHFVMIAIVSLIISVVLSPLRAGYLIVPFMNSGSICNMANLIVYFVATICMIKWQRDKLSPSVVLGAVLIGGLIVELPIHIIHWNSTITSLLDLFSRCIGILFGFLYIKYYKRKVAITFVFSIVSIFVVFFVSDWWSSKVFPEARAWHFDIDGNKTYIDNHIIR